MGKKDFRFLIIKEDGTITATEDPGLVARVLADDDTHRVVDLELWRVMHDAESDSIATAEDDDWPEEDEEEEEEDEDEEDEDTTK